MRADSGLRLALSDARRGLRDPLQRLPLGSVRAGMDGAAVMLCREVSIPSERPHPVRYALVGSLVIAVLSAGWLVLVLCACDVEQEVKGIGADVAEVAGCPFIGCGEVFQCTLPTEEVVEWCWMDDSASELEAVSGALLCEPTPRGGALGWPCIYQCPSKRGCNSYSGCFCGAP